MAKRLASVALTAVLAIAVAACGSDDKDDSGLKAGADVDAGTDAELGDELGAFTKECAELVQVYAGAYASVGSIMAGTATDELEEAAQYFEDVADALPDEIKADFALFAEAYNEFAKAVVEADIDFGDPTNIDPQQFAKLSTLTEKLESAEVEEASERISAYLEAKCGDGSP